jgi:HEAT repeat protein
MPYRCRFLAWIAVVAAPVLALAGCGEEIDSDQVVLKQLAHPNADERWNAVLSLRSLEPVPPQFVPSLLKALDDQDPRVRQAAAEALGELGASGRSQLNELTKLSNEHPDAQVRFALQQSVAKINRAQ